MVELFVTKTKESMVTMIRNFFRHLFESLKSLKRNGWMTIVVVGVVTLTLALVSVVVAILMNVTYLVQKVEEGVNVMVYIETGTDQAGIDKLGEELNAIANVQSVEFSSKDEQLKQIAGDYGQAFEDAIGEENPLYDAYVVKTASPETVNDVSAKAKELENVNDVNYGGPIADKIISISKQVQKWSAISVVVLLLVAILLISNTIRITIIARRQEIEIMRLVGARNSYIRWPFFFEGAWIGVLGSILPIVMTTFGYTYVYNLLNPILRQDNFSLLAPGQIVIYINIIVLITGIVIGSLGSVISMGRFLKK